MLSHGGSVIPNFFANCRSHDKKCKFSFFRHVIYQLVKNVDTPFRFYQMLYLVEFNHYPKSLRQVRCREI